MDWEAGGSPNVRYLRYGAKKVPRDVWYRDSGGPPEYRAISRLRHVRNPPRAPDICSRSKTRIKQSPRREFMLWRGNSMFSDQCAKEFRLLRSFGRRLLNRGLAGLAVNPWGCINDEFFSSI